MFHVPEPEWPDFVAIAKAQNHSNVELRRRLEELKNWHVGTGSTFTEVGERMLAISELNLRIAELLLKPKGDA